MPTGSSGATDAKDKSDETLTHLPWSFFPEITPHNNIMNQIRHLGVQRKIPTKPTHNQTDGRGRKPGNTAFCFRFRQLSRLVC